MKQGYPASSQPLVYQYVNDQPTLSEATHYCNTLNYTDDGFVAVVVCNVEPWQVYSL